ncbi:hypothetical protein CQW23_14072 [Capsicum baccatum]|uniref:Uncharacterized protein n=1 Tax=Capsicum baccatum TaxID=33114 RepID=A0A2G2WI49_CAPBA|nr:hypothetical protein CQW23_14072 [Capsicum baccatum]
MLEISNISGDSCDGWYYSDIMMVAVDSGGGGGYDVMLLDFSVIKSPVCILKFVAVGARLVAGFESGQVAMLDVSSSSVLLITDCLSSSSSRITSVAVKTLGDALEDTMEHCEERRTNPYVKEGDINPVHEVKLAKPCSRTSILKNDTENYGLVLVYQNGLVEIRSLLDLEVLGELSLTSILGWNSKINMDKTISSPGKAMISLVDSYNWLMVNDTVSRCQAVKKNLGRMQQDNLVNGSEFAVISLLAFGNDFRIPEALPSLHKKSLMTAAADVSISQQQKKKQNVTNSIFGGIVKGLKGFKEQHAADYVNAQDALVFHLENIFCRFPFSDPTNVTDDLGSLELKLEKETDRDRLLEGGPSEVKPILRTREEIVAKYRNKGDAAFAAAQAKDKLLERREKLEIHEPRECGPCLYKEYSKHIPSLPKEERVQKHQKWNILKEEEKGNTTNSNSLSLKKVQFLYFFYPKPITAPPS